MSDVLGSLLAQNLKWILKLAEEALRADDLGKYHGLITTIGELVEGHHLVAEIRNATRLAVWRPHRPKKARKGGGEAKGADEADIDTLIVLCWQKITELDGQARATLEAGEYKGYVDIMRTIATFLKTNADLLIKREKLRGKEKGTDLAALLAQVKRRIIGIFRRVRK